MKMEGAAIRPPLKGDFFYKLTAFFYFNKLTTIFPQSMQ